MRKTLVDTIATVVFFTLLAGFAELFVAGMEPRQVLTTRLIMIPMMVLTGRPYGLWRDWMFKTSRPTVSWSKTIIDALAFLSFQLPVYGLTLFIAGADGTEILTLLGTTSILMLMVSRPFGLYLDAVRRWAGIERV